MPCDNSGSPAWFQSGGQGHVAGAPKSGESAWENSPSSLSVTVPQAAPPPQTTAALKTYQQTGAPEVIVDGICGRQMWPLMG
ncbi:hypothetical protein GCM10023237_00270 [Streptomyces coeruleoprunus]